MLLNTNKTHHNKNCFISFIKPMECEFLKNSYPGGEWLYLMKNGKSVI